MRVSRPALLGGFNCDGLRGNRVDGLQARLGGNLQAEEKTSAALAEGRPNDRVTENLRVEAPMT